MDIGIMTYLRHRNASTSNDSLSGFQFPTLLQTLPSSAFQWRRFGTCNWIIDWRLDWLVCSSLARGKTLSDITSTPHLTFVYPAPSSLPSSALPRCSVLTAMMKVSMSPLRSCRTMAMAPPMRQPSSPAVAHILSIATLGDLSIWTAAELTAAVVCASLPTLRPLLQKFNPEFVSRLRSAPSKCDHATHAGVTCINEMIALRSPSHKEHGDKFLRLEDGLESTVRWSPTFPSSISTESNDKWNIKIN